MPVGSLVSGQPLPPPQSLLGSTYLSLAYSCEEPFNVGANLLRIQEAERETNGLKNAVSNLTAEIKAMRLLQSLLQGPLAKSKLVTQSIASGTQAIPLHGAAL